MRSCLAKKLLPIVAVCCAACSNGAAPFDDSANALNNGHLCTGGGWAAIQRENQPWQTIDATEATVSLNAGEKIALALLPNLGPHHGFDFFFLTAEQAAAAFPCGSSSTKSVQGTVKGLEAGTAQPGYLSIGNASTDLSNGPFTLNGVPFGKADLVASRLDAPPKTIIRRGFDYPNGFTIPLLDFGSSEAIWLEPNTVTVSGATNVDFSVMSEVVTERGTTSLLSEDGSKTTLTMYSVPESRLTTGELQYLAVDAVDERQAMVFYRDPSDRTVTLGPDASTVTETSTATGTYTLTVPNVTFRFDMPSQPEYGAQVAFALCINSPGGTSSSRFVATREYFGGTPAVWSVAVPDLTSVLGHSLSYPSGSYLCGATVTSSPFSFSARSAHDGDIYLSASAHNFVRQ